MWDSRNVNCSVGLGKSLLQAALSRGLTFANLSKNSKKYCITFCIDKVYMVYANVCLVSCESIDLLTLTRQAELKVVGEEIIFGNFTANSSSWPSTWSDFWTVMSFNKNRKVASSMPGDSRREYQTCAATFSCLRGASCKAVCCFKQLPNSISLLEAIHSLWPLASCMSLSDLSLEQRHPRRKQNLFLRWPSQLSNFCCWY